MLRLALFTIRPDENANSRPDAEAISALSTTVAAPGGAVTAATTRGLTPKLASVRTVQARPPMVATVEPFESRKMRLANPVRAFGRSTCAAHTTPEYIWPGMTGTGTARPI